jgi:hypothetical protein
VTRRRGAAAAISESNMGEGQVPKEMKCGVLRFVFSAASKNTHSFGRGPVNVGIVDRHEGYVS